MPLFLRPNAFDSEDHRDYSVIERDDAGERVIGRIYSGAGLRLDKWLYAINGWGSALADSREDAMAKLKAVWERLQKPGSTPT